MVIVDDHLAVLAIAGSLPDGIADGWVATTYSFHYRLCRAVAAEASDGSLSSRFADTAAPVRRVVRPPADRLLVLDPRLSVDDAVQVSARRRANLLLAELVGAAHFHRAKVLVTGANVGRAWPAIMEAEAIEFEAISPEVAPP